MLTAWYLLSVGHYLSFACYLPPVTCYLLLVICYLFLLSIQIYLNFAIFCKKIASFRSWSATCSCCSTFLIEKVLGSNNLFSETHKLFFYFPTVILPGIIWPLRVCPVINHASEASHQCPPQGLGFQRARRVGCPYLQKVWPLILPMRYVIPMYENIHFPEFQSFPTSSSFGKSLLKMALTPL